DKIAAALDNDHRAVIQIGDALSMLFAVFDDLDENLLTRQYDRLHGIRQIVDVQHRHTLQLAYFVQVEVIRDDLTPQHFRQLHKLAVHFRNFVEIPFIDQHFHVKILLDFVQNVESAPASIPLQQVRRIGNMLQLLQDKLGNDQRSFNKTRFADVGDPA